METLNEQTKSPLLKVYGSFYLSLTYTNDMLIEFRKKGSYRRSPEALNLTYH